MLTQVRIATSWPQDERAALIDQVRAEPHVYTQADLDFAWRVFKQTSAEFWAQYYEADRMAYVHRVDALFAPMYIFCVGPTGFISTLTHASFQRLLVTKALLRFARSDEGRAFFEGTHGAGDVVDIDNGIFSGTWAQALGFVYCDTVEAYGTRFNRYLFQPETV